VVLAREDTPGDKRLVAYVTLRDGHTLPAADARKHLSTRLPDYMLPTHVVALEAFPLTPNKKIDRKVLPSPADLIDDESTLSVDPAPRLLKGDALETRQVLDLLGSVWKEVLGVGRLDPKSNLFDLGVRSLQVLRVHEALSRLLESPPTILELFEHPTIYDLACHLCPPNGPRDGSPVGPKPEIEVRDASRERKRADARRSARSRRNYLR
jgi:hypothetical protein